MSSNKTNKTIVALILSAAVVIVFVAVCKKSTATIEPVAVPQQRMPASDTELPIACVSTLGGDIMMCPSSGICPLNGQRCQPTTDSKPCCTDWYYPQSTMDLLYAQHHNHTMQVM